MTIPHPKGWDIADAIRDGWTHDDLLKFLRENAKPWTPKKEATDTQAPVAESREETPNEGTGSVAQLIPTAQAVPSPSKPKPRAHLSVISSDGIVNPHAWRGELLTNEEGKLQNKSLRNLMLVLTHHDLFKGVFGWNSFASLICIMRPPPWVKPNGHFDIRPMSDNDVTQTVAALEYVPGIGGLRTSTNDCGKAIQVAAEACSFNPVTEYFDSLTWDGIPRIRGGMWEGDSIAPWLSEYLGAADTEANKAFGTRFLLSVAARAYKPGCQMRTMLVLEGPQDFGKSKALKTLANNINGKDYYSDAIQLMHGADAEMALQGKLLVEVKEMAAFFKTGNDFAKGFLDKEYARFRPPYGKNFVEYPRSCVICGTINPPEHGYMTDASGATRFHPVRVTDINIPHLAADRDQLWAEARELYKAGEQHWLTDREAEMARPVQQMRYQIEIWGKKIDRHIKGQQTVEVDAILGTLGIPSERANSTTLTRISNHLTTRGWKSRSGVEGVFDAPRRERLI